MTRFGPLRSNLRRDLWLIPLVGVSVGVCAAAAALIVGSFFK